MITILLNEDHDTKQVIKDISHSVEKEIAGLQRAGIKCIVVKIIVSDWRDNEHK